MWRGHLGIRKLFFCKFGAALFDARFFALKSLVLTVVIL